MPATHLTLVLNPSASGQGCAPNYEPWTPAPADGSRRVAIYNASGYQQILSSISGALISNTSNEDGGVSLNSQLEYTALTTDSYDVSAGTR